MQPKNMDTLAIGPSRYIRQIGSKEEMCCCTPVANVNEEMCRHKRILLSMNNYVFIIGYRKCSVESLCIIIFKL